MRSTVRFVMANEVSNDDILQLFASENDLLFGEDSASDSVGSDNVLLKFHNGNPLTSSMAVDIAEFLLNHPKLNICGLSFKANSILFEVTNNRQLTSWLVRLFESRQSNTKLTSGSHKNILSIAKGKFSVLINQVIMLLAVIPGTSFINFPCLNNVLPYGLCNDPFANICVYSLSLQPSEIILEFLKVRKVIDELEMNLIYGIRLDWNEDSDTRNLRLMLNRTMLTDRLLIRIKEKFGTPSLSSDTFHIIPTLLKTTIESELSLGRNLSDFWKFVESNDLLTCKAKEMTVVSKKLEIKPMSNAKKLLSKSPTRRLPEDRPSSSSGSIFNRLQPRKKALNYRVHENHVPYRSIFSRLQPKETALSQTEKNNILMNFRPIDDHHVKDTSTSTLKLKSVVKKLHK